MRRREFLKMAGAAVLVPGLSSGESIFASKTASVTLNKMSLDKPNIIFILADDLGYGQVGCYGQQLIKTPNIDKIATEGMKFTQHYAGGPVCAPSRACLMTGKSQLNGFIKDNPINGVDEPLRPGDVTIAEILKAKGYDTACIGKWGLGSFGSMEQRTSGYPTNKGFNYFCGYDTHESAHDYWPSQVCRNNGTVALTGNVGGAHVTYSHDFFANEALSFIDKPRSVPFFMYLAFTIPHEPYDPPDMGQYASKSWPADYRNIASMITRMDGDIGRIMDKLKAKGIDNNTIIFFAGDNGPGSSYTTKMMDMVNFFEMNGQMIGMKRDVYDGGVRIPMLVRWPGKIAAGTVSNHISGFQDILPTLAEIAGGVTPTGIDGISMAPTLFGKNDQQQKHTFMYWEYIHANESWGGRQSALMVEGNYKGVRYGSKGKLELYDLDTDAAEQHDISGANPQIVSQIEAFMNSRQKSYDPDNPSQELWVMPETGNKYPLSGMNNWFVKPQ